MPTDNIHSTPEHLEQYRAHFQRLIAGRDPEIDPEAFKRELRTMLAGTGNGIDLDTPSQWTIEGITKPEPFFRSLRALLPTEAILYFEGRSIAKDVAAFYLHHRACNAVAVIRDCVFPVPDIHHVAFSEELLAQLESWSLTRPTEELFHHIKAYCQESLLFTFHDAFAGCLRISEHVSETAVQDLCRGLGVTARREPTKRRDLEQLRGLLWMMENPEQVRFTGEPWWRRLWRRWTLR